MSRIKNIIKYLSNRYKTWSTGTKYIGEWKDGEWHGHGTYEYGGEKYTGEWKHGKKNGQGTYNYPDYRDARKYVGEWKDGKIR